MTYTPPLNGGRINVTLAGNSTSAGGGYALASTGTVTLAGGNNITLSQNANAITISGGAGGGGVALANSQTTYSSGTVNMLEGGGAITIASGAGQSLNFSVPQTSSLSATGQVSISTNGSTISIGAPSQTVQPGIQSIQASNTTYTTGNVIFSNANGLSFGSSAGGAITASYTVPTQTVQPGIASIQASNTTYTSGKVIFSNANGMSFGSSAGSGITASYTVPTQTNQSVGLYAGSNTTVNTSGTADARSISFAGAGGVSVEATNGSVVISGGAGGAGLSAGMSTGGNTAGTTGTVTNQLIFAGGNNVTLSQSTGAGGNTLSISAPNFGTAAAAMAVQIAGNSTSAGGGYSTVTSGTMQWAGGNNITLSQNAQSITISGGPGPIASQYIHNSAAMYSSSTSAMVNTSVSLVRMLLPAQLSFSRVDIPVSFSGATSATANTAAMALSAVGVIYSRNASTLNAIVGQSSTTTYSYASNSGVYSSITGPRVMSFNLATSLSGGEYYFGFQMSSATSSVGTATTNLGWTLAPIFGTSYTVLPWQDISAATAASINIYQPLQGMNSVSISNTTQTHQQSQITQSGATAIRANLVVVLRNN